MTHVQKRKLVYGAYRDMLRNYNERANEILESKPPSSLTEDRGVSERIDTIIMQQQQQQQSGGGPPPPPPPPPPPGHGVNPRLRTEIPAVRAEPPACVQNAMMTKDKKPFTYTPGGLDLSQIRSPRMARRLTRNANSEGVEATAPLQSPAPPQPPTPMMVSPAPQQVAVPQPPPPPPSQPAAQQCPRPQLVIPAAGVAGRSAQVGSLYVPPLESPVTLNKAPTPWLTRSAPQQVEQQQQAPWVQQQQYRPAPVQASPAYSPSTPASSYSPSTPASPYSPPAPTSSYNTPSPLPSPQPQAVSATRVVPVQIQMRPQACPPTPQPTQYQQSPPVLQQQPQQQHSGPVTRIIPIQLETDSSDGPPVQSPAFRVLQKMTSREDPGEQMRRLQLSEDDRTLMNKLRAQVDDETFLHNEVDPRYRGAAIPSRAFRILQHMTDTDGMVAGEPQQTARMTRPQAGGRPGGESASVPASEQQAAQEPRKYTGGAIPSRSFQILQAMVEPNACAPGSETDTESNDSYHVDPWYYHQVPHPTIPYWPPDPYWAYYMQPPPPSGAMQCAEQQYEAALPYYPGYEYSYYGHPYAAYPYAYDPYQSYESEAETSLTEPLTTDTEEAQQGTGVGLQAIRSVSDIHRVYDNEDDSKTETDGEEHASRPLSAPYSAPTSSHSEDDDDDEDDDEDTDEEMLLQDGRLDTTGSDDHVPHQLSVIFEESDAGLSDATDRRRETSVASEDDSSTTIAVESGDEEETVTVRLPLRFKFTRTENDEDVTTVIVGDSQVDKCNSVSVTVSIPSPGANSSSAAVSTHCSDIEDSESYEANATATVTLPVTSAAPHATLLEQEELEVVRVSVKDRILAIERCGNEKQTLTITQEEDVQRHVSGDVNKNNDVEEDEDEDEDEDEEEEDEEEEEEEEEEVDSGVTSQTDTESECFQEVRRLNKYQRAATHSRLYKLLHDLEDDQDEDEQTDDTEEQGLDPASIVMSKGGRQQLSLPLVACSRSSVPDSFSSSGIASPASTPPRRARGPGQSDL